MSSDRFSSNSPLTIIPQRKHRKLLKDGSGTEVWPESIEQVFVQGTLILYIYIYILHHLIDLSGLRDYWNSPYAIYSQSRGRSRWRNQYLVDYLHKQGIKRSKKQVASHIQVLRNMWKGAPGLLDLSQKPSHLLTHYFLHQNTISSLAWTNST